MTPEKLKNCQQHSCTCNILWIWKCQKAITMYCMLKFIMWIGVLIQGSIKKVNVHIPVLSCKSETGKIIINDSSYNLSDGNADFGNFLQSIWNIWQMTTPSLLKWHSCECHKFRVLRKLYFKLPNISKTNMTNGSQLVSSACHHLDWRDKHFKGK